MQFLQILCGLCIILTTAYSCVATIYDHQNDPSIWAGACQSGINQSPINLIEAKATISPKLAGLLIFKSYEKPIGRVKLQNNGKSIKTTFTNAKFDASVLFQSRIYILEEQHAHWGKSEHALNGRNYDGEVHFVHRDILNPSKHLVLAVLLKKAVASDSFITNILNQGSDLKKYGASKSTSFDFSLRQVLGNINTKKIFSYEGSLTSPNCTENVHWIVFRDVLEVDDDALAKLKTIQDKNGQPLTHTYRNIQPVGKRMVFRTYRLK